MKTGRASIAMIVVILLLSLVMALGASYFELGTLGSQFVAWASGVVFAAAVLLAVAALGKREVPPPPAFKAVDMPPMVFAPALPEDNFYTALQNWVNDHPQYRIRVDDNDGKIWATATGVPPALVVFVSGEGEQGEDEFENLEDN